MINWICSHGYTVDFVASPGWIEFSHKTKATFWKLSIREAFEYLGGQ